MTEASINRKKKGDRSLWFWVILAFVLLISAWTGLIIISSNNKPELIEFPEH